MEEVYTMYVQDTARMLVSKGYAEAHVHDDGQLGYTITDKGQELL